MRDRVVQASMKLVLEPIFEAISSRAPTGSAPSAGLMTRVAEVYQLTSHSYEWIVEGDIKACFDEISHSGLIDRVRRRIGDRRVLDLVKAFCKAGILGEDRVLRENTAGTPQGSILSPCSVTWHCRCWTSISPRPGRARDQPMGTTQTPTSRAGQTTGWSASPTTGACAYRVPGADAEA